jgi:hypothetical protein
MVGDCEGKAGLGHFDAALGKAAEGVEGAFVQVVPIDPEERLATLAAHDLVRRPQLVD